MKSDEFNKAVYSTPHVMARFRLTKPEKWMSNPNIATPPQKGDHYLFHPNGLMISERGHSNISAYPSKFEFVGYFYVKDHNSSPKVISEIPLTLPTE